MTTLTHVSVGYFIARGFALSGILPDANSTYLLSMVFANAPDIDAIILTRRLYAHRENFYSLSHFPASWAVLFSLAFLIITNQAPKYITYLVMCGISVISHFILDSFDIFEGISWFGPWIKRRFSFVSLVISPFLDTADYKKLFHIYKKHWLFYIECIICILAFAIAFVT